MTSQDANSMAIKDLPVAQAYTQSLHRAQSHNDQLLGCSYIDSSGYTTSFLSNYI